MTTESSKNVEETVRDSKQNLIKLYQSETFSLDGILLVCVKGPHQGLEILFDKEHLVIGRDAWCDIALPEDKRLSRCHCELTINSEGVIVQDLQSKNGVFLNGNRVFRAPFMQEQRLLVGDSVFTLMPTQKSQAIKVHHYDQSGLLVGKNPKMRKLFSMLERIADSDISLLLLGETGTGKTSVARALHEQSGRSDGPFVTVNCGALASTLVEASLFGYEVGAFTDAKQQHQGFFEQADSGTLFLDEIGELPAALQPKLLDVLERQSLRRLGGEKEIKVNFRLITATHRDPKDAIEMGTLREDLFYRLAGIELEVPPLRERLEDIPLLVQSIFADKNFGKRTIPLCTQDAIRKLQRHLWPGNIRELKNVLHRSFVLLKGNTLQAEDIFMRGSILNHGPEPHPQDESQCSLDTLSDFVDDQPLQVQMERWEKVVLLSSLEASDWNVVKTAKQLGVSRSVLYSRIQKHNLKRPDKDNILAELFPHGTQTPDAKTDSAE